MLQFKYTPETWDTPLGPLSDPSPIQEMTMTLSGECVTWEEATREFHNFLRAAGYVIPYDIEWYEDGKDEVDYIDCSDPPDIDKSGSLGDRQPVWVNRMSDDGDADPLQNLTDWEEKYRPDEREWVNLDGIWEAGKFFTPDFIAGAEWAETKLKEKNTL